MWISVAGSHVVVCLEGALNLADLAQVNDDLLQTPSIQSIDIDLSGVTEIDAAGVRFLAFLQKEATVAGKSCRLISPPNPCDTIRDLVALPGQDPADGPADTRGSP